MPSRPNVGPDRIGALVAAATRTRALLIVTEDMHCPDEQVLARISTVAAATNNCALLLGLTSRNVGAPWREDGGQVARS
jgi:hypothetical protein